jgi:hypothetical protein
MLGRPWNLCRISSYGLQGQKDWCNQPSVCLVLWCRELLSKTRVNMYLMCKLGLKTRKPVKSDLTCAKLVNSVKIVLNHPSLCFCTFLILYARYSSLSFVLCLKKER